MAKYSAEFKAAILKQLLPPHNCTVVEVAQKEHIAVMTLYNWRKQAKEQGAPVPGKTSSTDNWSAEAKLSVVIATATLSENELGQYCRENGLYPIQVQQWKSDCLNGFATSQLTQNEIKKQAKSDKARISQLEKELRHKEKALAEAAALLLLRKKARAFYGDDPGEI